MHTGATVPCAAPGGRRGLAALGATLLAAVRRALWRLLAPAAAVRCVAATAAGLRGLGRGGILRRALPLALLDVALLTSGGWLGMLGLRRAR